ncbi:MAG: hypothetical protein IKM97_04885 [Clostridia bacterium]|nr:hypothetical protein [Clostridia bacterium]
MKYLPLIESCKEAIANNWCLGCQALENPNFRGNYYCKYNKEPSADEKPKENIGIQESFFQ